MMRYWLYSLIVAAVMLLSTTCARAEAVAFAVQFEGDEVVAFVQAPCDRSLPGNVWIGFDKQGKPQHMGCWFVDGPSPVIRWFTLGVKPVRGGYLTVDTLRQRRAWGELYRRTNLYCRGHSGDLASTRAVCDIRDML